MKTQMQIGESTHANLILLEIVSRLVAEFNPHMIYLFGSRASGTARHDSDYDILVVMPLHFDSARRLAARAYELLDDLDIALDILFTNKNKFEQRKSIMNTLAEIASNDGKQLYAV